MTETSNLLRATDLDFAYRKVPVLVRFNLTLDQGQVVSILGPNGSGKSTLLKILLGHLRGKGTVLWQNRRLRNWPRRELARLVAYLPQSPLVDEAQTVTEILSLGRAPYWGAFGVETAKDAAAIDAIVDQLQMDRSLLSRRLDQLSGGQRQRVFIARCLVQQPQVLLLDEPTNNLDLSHQLQLLGLLRDLARKQNMAVLMTAHDINLAADFSDRLVLLREGELLANGSPTDILSTDLLHHLYGVPMELIARPGRSPIAMPAPQ